MKENLKAMRLTTARGPTSWHTEFIQDIFNKCLHSAEIPLKANNFSLKYTPDPGKWVIFSQANKRLGPKRSIILSLNGKSQFSHTMFQSLTSLV